MRTIQKGRESKELRGWKKDNQASPQNIDYENIDASVKAAMLLKLAEEQGWLCAYTMKSLHHKSGPPLAHIEHIFPRACHRDQSVDWGNMLACVPQHGVWCDYGAQKKGAYDPARNPFVNPTKAGVEGQFRFRENGEVEGLTPDASASIAVNVLNLNHPDLVNDRKGKIKGAISRKPSAAEARRRAQELRKRDGQGRLEPYCEAVAQVLENYAGRLERRAARIAGAIRS